MECKFETSFLPFRLAPVLIETLWNVNGIISDVICAVIYVLIETLWNVNVLKPAAVVSVCLWF